MRKIRVNKTWGLRYVDFFLEVPIQKGIFNIKLFDGPLKINSQSKNQTDCAGLHYRTKGVKVVDPSCLSKALGYQPTFVAIY